MLHFTTYFDKNYLSRGLVLYESLKEQSIQFELHLLCLDDFTLEYFKNRSGDYPEIITLSLCELEGNDSELKNCRNNRSRIEFYFTLSPCLPLYVLKKWNLPHICSLDADILFLDTPMPLFNYLAHYSVIITPHKFSDEIKALVKYGIYNVSFQIFKNDETGVNCLGLWRKQCIEWCGDQYDEINDRFADQKYLDYWSELFPNKVKILDDNISGLAPWNLNNFKLEKRENKFYSNHERIIFYHFHDFKLFNKSIASNGLYTYGVKYYSIIGKLYLTYWGKLNRVNVFLNILNDQSVRYVHSNNLWERVFREKYIYFKLLNLQIFFVSPVKLPKIIKYILVRMNIKSN
jgi:hypothetical protein